MASPLVQKKELYDSVWNFHSPTVVAHSGNARLDDAMFDVP